MKTKPQRQIKIVQALSTKRLQTFQELYKLTKMGRGALAMGLKELEHQGIVKRNDKKEYYLVTKTKGSKTKNTRIIDSDHVSDIMNFDLDEGIEELRSNKEPFVIGYTLLRNAMFSIPKLSLELHSSKLTSSEKKEYEDLIKRYNQTIKKTFEVLEEIDFEQTLALKQGLDNAMTIPQYELKMADLANKRHKKRAGKI